MRYDIVHFPSDHICDLERTSAHTLSERITGDAIISMWRPLLVLAAFALTITTSAALTLSLTRNTSLALLTPTNITSSALGPPAELDNYGRYPSWPKTPYYVALPGTGFYIDVFLEIYHAVPFDTTPKIDVRDLELFIQDFADGFRQEYPVPGFIPREATLYASDVTSHTRWTLWTKEGPFKGRVPTAVALAALDQLEKELGKYGPANVGWTIRLKGRFSIWALGQVKLEKLTGASSNESLSNENDNLQTA